MSKGLLTESKPVFCKELLPKAEWLKSVPMTVELPNLDFAPPALTNQWASLVAGRDFFSYSGLAAPPIHSDEPQAEVFIKVGNCPMQAGIDARDPLTYTWYPGRITRQGKWQHLEVETTTAIGVRAHAVLNHLRITNPTAESEQVDLFMRMRADLRTEWAGPANPNISYDGDAGILRMKDAGSAACAFIGSDLLPKAAASFSEEDERWEQAKVAGVLPDEPVQPEASYVVIHYQLDIAANSHQELQWVHVLTDYRNEARRQYNDHHRNFQARVAEVQEEWELEWQAAFTPGNPRFSGYLPMLHTDEEKLKRLYYMGIMNLLYCKRTRRFGSPGLTYGTGLPSSEFTFTVTSAYMWDAMMVSGILSMLDPDTFRQMIEEWIIGDMHKGHGIDFLTGEPLGYWYAVNDYALIHMARQYVRYTGNKAWLQSKVAGKSILAHLQESADYWKHIADEDGLADYGEAENLLECVSTYTHKVASFNSANVWNARTVAAISEMFGEVETATRLREQANTLAAAIKPLYNEGEGFWSCKQPDGSLLPVRHCLDFFTVLQCMNEDLTAKQKEEMLDFFFRELKTSTWMHALSPLDPDTAHSSRTDHQDDGAFTTWPAYSLEVLLQNGKIEEALEWIGTKEKLGIADVTLQGPFGQAYYHGDDDSPRIAGAAAKAPMEEPFIEKPVLLPGGKYSEVIIEMLAGINPQLDGDVKLTRKDIPIRLSLENVLLRGMNYRLEIK